MNKEKLDSDLRELANRKNELSTLDYSSAKYDTLEEELHEKEDAFQEEFGDFLEAAIKDIHDKYCPKFDALIPIAYLANKYIFNEEKVDVQYYQGVKVDIDDYPDQKSSLVLVPGPVRILLLVDEEVKEEVWRLES